MARIRQFAKDMGLSYNEAKNLVNKGRRLKDGGSATLEKFMPVKAKNGKVTRINKDKTMQAKSGQFKNIVKDSVSGKITPEEAQKMIRKLVIAKQSGGGFDDEFKALQALNREFDRAKAKPTAQKMKEQLKKDIKDAPDKGTKSFLTRELKAGGKKAINLNLLPTEFQTEKEKKKFLGGDKPKKKATKGNTARIGAGTSKMRKSMPRGDITKKMKDGGAAFPDLSGDGKVTKKDILIGRGVIKKSRGGGIAIQGTGFKGVR